MNRGSAQAETVEAPGRSNAAGSNDVADPREAPAISVDEVITGIHRVALGETTVGYVQDTGDRFVSLLGSVYNTSVEVAQTLTLDTAVRRLLLA
ncbi:MAG TPA: hypothetical protein VFQ74_09975 [Pseudolysinimonas sp.]|nr:hypothetical protein [Pseudolysinimonas sp.]